MSWNIAKPGDQINGPVAVTGNLNVDSNTLFVDSANNRVGVLTASPTVPLDVVGDAKVSGNLTVDTNTLVVDAANNRLGIGTATPATTLEVALSGAGTPRARFTSDSNNPVLELQRWTGGALDYFGNRIVTGASGEAIFQTAGAAALGSQTFTTRLTIASDGVCTWSNVGGVAGTAMTLNGTGLGIGNSPIYNLTVKGVLNTVGIINDSSNRSRICFAEYATPANSYTNIEADARSTGYISLRTNDQHRVRIDSDGNVGINATTPAYKLHVNAANPGNGVIAQFYNNATSSLNGASIILTQYGIADWYVGQPAGVSALEFGRDKTSGAAGTGLMRLDSSGNLGLGVTPSSTIFSGDETRLVVKGNANYYAGTIAVQSKGTVNAVTGFLTATDGSNAVHVGALTNSDLKFYTNGTSKATLDASGRLLIGGTSTYDFAGQANLVVNGTSNNATLTIASTGIGYIAFADGTTGTSRYVGRIDYDHAADTMYLTANAVERLAIKKNGQVNFIGLASDPAGAAAGDVYYNTTTNKLKCYNGTTWNDLF